MLLDGQRRRKRECSQTQEKLVKMRVPGKQVAQFTPLLMQFLEAETYDQRLGIFDEMEGIADMHMLNAVAASLDVTLGDTTIEEAFSLIRDNLATQKKYECSRWR